MVAALAITIIVAAAVVGTLGGRLVLAIDRRAARRHELADAVAALTETAPPLRGRRVTVHTKRPDDQTITGVLVHDYPDRLGLVDASYVTADGTTPMPGADAVRWFYTRSLSWVDDHGVAAAREE